ncbi:DUF3533 domain-containing protein [Allostreptomyces psammosilenae]|uniref:DUF3533 domain-containing protein n=1 Tax=Allostreptomyces psammosilenae TaxID=1892865 RepID=A0A852ZZP2_9ACTN|nr:DUF3533 domain-containing protein [Allostreptomyces psammosilenae]NYI03598.1 hypothetical protein [Allostreptomyces psammosilenae]
MSTPALGTASPVPRRGFLAELRDALSVRGVALVVGVLALQLGFVLSYVGAFHSPTPHRVPVAVVAPEPAAHQIIDQLNALDGEPVRARAASDEHEARTLILDRTVDAAVVVDPRGSTDTLLVASAGGPAVSSTVAQIAERVESTRQRQVTVTDIRPPDPSDGRGLSSFYLVLGWMIGGYLAAAILGIAGGARPANPPRTLVRLAALAVYAVVSGLGGAILVDPVLGALTGHFVPLWIVGALLVYAVAATTVALQTLLGIIGVGVAILLFVVLGNPSAGGAYPTPLLPPFWRAIGGWLPPGAGTTVVRNTVYFSGHATAGAWWILAGYAAVGTVVALLASALLRGRSWRVAT